MSNAAGKPIPPRGPTDRELLAVGPVTPEEAPYDTLPMTDDERRALSKSDPEWIDGATVSAMIAERLRRG